MNNIDIYVGINLDHVCFSIHHRYMKNFLKALNLPPFAVESPYAAGRPPGPPPDPAEVPVPPAPWRDGSAAWP